MDELTKQEDEWYDFLALHQLWLNKAAGISVHSAFTHKAADGSKRLSGELQAEANCMVVQEPKKWIPAGGYFFFFH